MDIEKLCYGCFREKTMEVCPYCGFDPTGYEHPAMALPLGTILDGRYLTGKVLGIGGFGITYLGFDLTLEIKVAIKEYMPQGITVRNTDRYTMSLVSKKDEDVYEAGADRFLNEARILAKLQNTPNIVAVQNYFKENNTAYFVMEYIEGQSLKEFVSKMGGKIPYEQAVTILMPAMEALCQVHAKSLLHRDLSPDNIYITNAGETKLLDFGASRFALGDNKSMSVILKHGYAPEEQYRSHGNQGPWSDVYAMAVTMYVCITGIVPPDSIDRAHQDELILPSALGIEIPAYAEAAMLHALAIKAEDRYSDMKAFIRGLLGNDGPSGATVSRNHTAALNQTQGIGNTAPMQDTKKQENFFSRLKKNKPMFITVCCAICAGIALAILLPILLGGAKPAETENPVYDQTLSQPTTASSAVPTETTSTPPAEAESPVAAGSAYTNEALGITANIPEGFSATDNETTSLFIDANSMAYAYVYYVLYSDTTVLYSKEDFKNNYESVANSVIFQNHEDWESLVFGTPSTKTIGNNEFVGVELTANDSVESITGSIMCADSPNTPGCYCVLTYYYNDVAEQNKPDIDGLTSLIGSLQLTGGAHSTYVTYQTDVAGGIKFVYDSAKAPEPQVAGEDSTRKYIALIAESGSTVSVENCASYAQDAQSAAEYLHNLYVESFQGLTYEDQFTFSYGAKTYYARDYQMQNADGDTVYLTWCTTDMNGVTLAIGLASLEAEHQNTIDTTNLIAATLTPLAG